jgi:hypothetical protein
MPAKAKLTTRSTATTTVTSDNLAKGTELSFNEADSNFINLRDQSIAISDGVTTTDIEAGETITFSGASVSGNTVTITGGGGDLGDLQVNGTELKPVTTNNNLILTANGTGTVIVYDNLSVSSDNKTGNQLGNLLRVNASGITINHDGDYQSTIFEIAGAQGQDASYRRPFKVVGESGLGTGGSPSNTDGRVYINGIKFPMGPGSNGQVLTTNGTDEYSWTTLTPSGLPSVAGNSGKFLTTDGTSISWDTVPVPDIGNITFTGTTISAPSNSDISIAPVGTGKVVIDGLNYPTTDGSNGQVLVTDGAGNLSWASYSVTSFGGFTAVGTTLSSDITNSDITIDPNGTGKIVLSADLQVGGKIFTGASAITLAPNTTSTADLSTNGEPFISLTPTASGGHAQITVADTKYIFLTTDGYTGGNYGIVMNNSGITLAPKGTSRVNFATATSSTIGANGSASALTANPVGYLKIKVNGTEYQIPYYNI